MFTARLYKITASHPKRGELTLFRDEKDVMSLLKILSKSGYTSTSTEDIFIPKDLGNGFQMIYKFPSLKRS
jgi:hypothetical protein